MSFILPKNKQWGNFMKWKSFRDLLTFIIFKKMFVFWKLKQLEETLQNLNLVSQFSFTNKIQFEFFQITMSWELWKHPDPVPGGRPIFFKPKWPKKSKNGFKTFSCRPPLLLIFSKNCFLTKKDVEKIGHLVDFWILVAIHMDKLDQF